MARKPEPDGTLEFEAYVTSTGSSRQMFSWDGDGEARLVLRVPATEAGKVAARFAELLDRSFVVRIDL